MIDRLEGYLPEPSTHPSQPRFISPMVRNKSGNPSRRLRLSQVVHVPQFASTALASLVSAACQQSEAPKRPVGTRPLRVFRVGRRASGSRRGCDDRTDSGLGPSCGREPTPSPIASRVTMANGTRIGDVGKIGEVSFPR